MIDILTSNIQPILVAALKDVKRFAWLNNAAIGIVPEVSTTINYKVLNTYKWAIEASFDVYYNQTIERNQVDSSSKNALGRRVVIGLGGKYMINEKNEIGLYGAFSSDVNAVLSPSSEMKLDEFNSYIGLYYVVVPPFDFIRYFRFYFEIERFNTKDLNIGPEIFFKEKFFLSSIFINFNKTDTDWSPSLGITFPIID